ncbi:GNAT family N-acetyltransferase [Actinosynnema sp. NPDC023658]|uniref:GNAT family N-acetyltransferase n=1 Tax=Actinosynnema sp. NPDC023658 TaxID=3155465 RepID=UPI0033BFE528
MREMRELARRTWPTGRWHAGGLAWNLHHHPDPDRPVRVWGAHAWGRLPEPGVLEWQVDPDHPLLAEEVLDWAEGDTGLTEVVAWSGEPHQLDALTRRGYRHVPGPFFVRLARGLDHLPTTSVPDGYRCAHVTEDLVPTRVDAHRAAWHPSRLTERTYHVVRADEPYREDLDRVVLAPDGTVAAYCLAWLDDGVGEFEPVGAHPDHRRLGLARAACLDALHKLRDLGAHTAIVHARGDDAYPAPGRLYRSLGFLPTGQRTLTYRRPHR